MPHRPPNALPHLSVLAAAFALGCSSSSVGAPNVPADASAAVDAAAPVVDSAPPSGSTGDPCGDASACQGNTPVCRQLSKAGLVYLGGYCSSSCDLAANNSMSAVNPACPGAQGTCLPDPAAAPTVGACFELCTEKSGAYPCRNNYSCFLASDISAVCLPSSLSQCDPTQKGSCPADDAGARQTCAAVGLDAVGQCNDACDYFTQDCPALQSDAGMTAQGCFANDFGEGICGSASGTAIDGDSCQFIDDCAPGLGCHPEGATGAGVCRPYCGGPMSKTCTNGKKCVDLSTTVLKSTVGVCAG